MKKLLLIATLALMACARPTTVYLCMGPKSHAYHNNKYCKGLTNCSAVIKEVSKDEAIALHRTPCHYCIH
jgi:hypothetical protein